MRLDQMPAQYLQEPTLDAMVDLIKRDSTAATMSIYGKQMQKMARDSSESSSVNDQQSLHTLESLVDFQKTMKEKFQKKQRKLPRYPYHEIELGDPLALQALAADRQSLQLLEQATHAMKLAAVDKASLEHLLKMTQRKDQKMAGSTKKARPQWPAGYGRKELAKNAQRLRLIADVLQVSPVKGIQIVDCAGTSPPYSQELGESMDNPDDQKTTRQDPNNFASPMLDSEVLDDAEIEDLYSQRIEEPLDGQVHQGTSPEDISNLESQMLESQILDSAEIDDADGQRLDEPAHDEGDKTSLRDVSNIDSQMAESQMLNSHFYQSVDTIRDDNRPITPVESTTASNLTLTSASLEQLQKQCMTLSFSPGQLSSLSFSGSTVSLSSDGVEDAEGQGSEFSGSPGRRGDSDNEEDWEVVY